MVDLRISSLVNLFTAVNLVRNKFIVEISDTESSPCLFFWTCRVITAIGALEKGIFLIFQGFNLNLV
jgi:hypothetical protein